MSAILSGVLASAGGGEKFRFLRIVVVNTHAATLAGFYAIEYSEDGGATFFPSPNMTSDNTPVPLVSSVSSSFNASFVAWRAYDGLSGTRWVTLSNQQANSWSKIDLGIGNEKLPNLVRLTNNNAGGIGDLSPTEFGIYGSSTGIFAGEEVLIGSKAGLPSRAEGEVTDYIL